LGAEGCECYEEEGDCERGGCSWRHKDWLSRLKCLSEQ
jgi:hypothetical protein